MEIDSETEHREKVNGSKVTMQEKKLRFSTFADEFKT